jgi:hypothetical protein
MSLEPTAESTSQPQPSPAQNRAQARLDELKRALQRQLRRKPNLIEKALLDRCALVMQRAEMAAYDPKATSNDVVRLRADMRPCHRAEAHADVGRDIGDGLMADPKTPAARFRKMLKTASKELGLPIGDTRCQHYAFPSLAREQILARLLMGENVDPDQMMRIDQSLLTLRPAEQQLIRIEYVEGIKGVSQTVARHCIERLHSCEKSIASLAHPAVSARG